VVVVRGAAAGLIASTSGCRNLNGLGLDGELPLGSDVWGPLNTLTTLDLGNNMLNGYLPTAISALTNVKTINLANNNFSGARE